MRVTAVPAILALIQGVGCSQLRETPAPSPAFDVDVAPILASACAPCHTGPTTFDLGLPVAGWPSLPSEGGMGDGGRTAGAAGGWSVSTYLQTIACVGPASSPATMPASTRAPILTALESPAHAHVTLTASDKTTLEQWVAAGAPAFRADVHPPSFADPRSSDFHGAYLRGQLWAPMLDGNDANACGRCHAGVPAQPAGITLPAPNAPACTSCHAEPSGVLACNTCHGTATTIYPPRDTCFFPADVGGAHAAHVQASSLHLGRAQAEGGQGTPASSGYPCSTCHPVPGSDVISGLHGNGTVDVTFDPRVVSPEASYDPTDRTCRVSCHDAGGLRASWVWTDTTPTTCNDCHLSPPASHYPGACNACHVEANAAGTALTPGPLHLDGRVELGNGNGTCGACHGTGSSPWPTTNAHPAHETPSIARPVACEDCHPVPSDVLSPGHFQQGYVRVAWSGGATARGAKPVWNGTSCEDVACHGAKLPDPPAVVPVWTDTSGQAAACGACHAIPPKTGHTPSTECSRSDCHGSEVADDAQGVPRISSSGLALHIDGIIESARTP